MATRMAGAPTQGTGTALDVPNPTQGGPQVTDVSVNGQQAARPPKRNADELPDSEIVSINVRMPNGLRKQIAATGLSQSPQVSVPQLMTQMVAEAYSYELPAPARPARLKKYNSKEERLEAQKAQQKKQRDITKKILELVEAGKLEINGEPVDVEALLAQAAG